MPCQVLLRWPFVHFTDVKFKPRFSFVNCAGLYVNRTVSSRSSRVHFTRSALGVQASRCAYDLRRFCICFILDPGFNASQMCCIFSSCVLYIKNMSDPRCFYMKWCCIKKCKEQQKLKERTTETLRRDSPPKLSPTFSVRPRSSVGRVTIDLIRSSWVRFPPRSKEFFLYLVWFPDSLYQWVFHGFHKAL